MAGFDTPAMRDEGDETISLRELAGRKGSFGWELLQELVRRGVPLRNATTADIHATPEPHPAFFYTVERLSDRDMLRVRWRKERAFPVPYAFAEEQRRTLEAALGVKCECVPLVPEGELPLEPPPPGPERHPYHCVLCGTGLVEAGLGGLACPHCGQLFVPTCREEEGEFSLSWSLIST